MNWLYLDNNWVLCPPHVRGIIHFLGGAFIGTAPQIAYQTFLSRLAEAGYCIITPAFILQPNHDEIARDVTQSFRECHTRLCIQRPELRQKPIFGFGHSLGAKLQLLIGCQGEEQRNGTMLMAFNNFESDRAIPFADLIAPVFPIGFTPTPTETLARTEAQYQQTQTLLIQFETDTLDSSMQLQPILRQKFPRSFIDQRIPGNHLTPVNVNPLLSEEPQRRDDIWLDPNLIKLEQVTLKWLNYQQNLFSKS